MILYLRIHVHELVPTLTLVGREGVGRVPPHRAFRDSSKHAEGRQLKLGIPNILFKLDLLIPTAFSGQVRSLTYDVINKPLRGPQMLQLCNALSARGTFTGR